MHLAALGGHIEVIKYLLPLFGVRVHEKDMNSYTMLHWAAWGGHCQVAGYLIQELQMDPQNRDKVCGCQGTVRFQRARSTCVYGLLCMCSEACCDKTGVTWTSLCTVLCYAFRVPSYSLLTLLNAIIIDCYYVHVSYMHMVY